MTKPLRSQPTRDRILEAARKLFAEEGYERATIRAVAAAADIHASMVMRYYGSKENLFATAVAFDLEMPNLGAVPRSDLGTTLVRHFLRRWEAHDEELPALLRIAVTHAPARERLFALFREQIAPAIAEVVERERLAQCLGLVATQMLGLAFTRYVLRLPAVAALSEAALVDEVGATIQRYLTAPLATAADEAG